MGMMIEDCISKLTEILEEATEDENSVCYVTDVDEPTLKTAIDTMRKYQKIEDIVRNYYNEQYTDKLDIEIIEMISEVLEEDGRWED